MKKFYLLLAVWLGLGGALFAWDTKTSPTLPDGKPLQLVLPATEHMQNVGGSDGAGLCVYTSVTLAAKWHNIGEAYNLRKFAEGRPGGSYPEKLANDLKVYSQRYNVKLPTYVQHTGGDEAFLDLCIKTRRYPSVTYAGLDDFYGSVIAHMVNLVHLDEQHGVIQDNNRSGKFTGDTRRKVLNRWKGLDDNGRALRIGPYTVGGGWAFVWIAPPAPPPIPKATPTEGSPVVPEGRWERVVLGDFYSWKHTDPDSPYIDTVVWVYWVKGEPLGGFCRGKFYDITIRDGEVVGLGEEKKCPCGLHPPICDPTTGWNNGIDTGKVSTTPRYWINDVEVSQVKAYALVTDPGDEGLVDDSDRYHLSIIGDPALKAKIPEKYLRRVHVQVYTSADWPARTILSHAVTLQEPASRGGKVIGIGATADEAVVLKVLSDVFDPPLPPAPPVKPMPTPEPPGPVPTPKPDPAPAPEPKKELPVWVWVLGGLLLLIWRGR